MGIPQTAAGLVALTAACAWANERWTRLPMTIGVMVLSLVLSLALAGLSAAGFGGVAWLSHFLAHIDFSEALMQGMLSFMLFAGALSLDIEEVRRHRLVVNVLATAGTALSTLLVGGALYGVQRWLGLGATPAECLLFGALISPTDPIAVLAIVRKAGVSKDVQMTVAAESLLNDGVGVVLFSALLASAAGRAPLSALGVAKDFVVTAFGGVGVGLSLGWLAWRMLRAVDNYRVEVLVTLALVMGSYTLALSLGVSGPLATVAAGLVIGHARRTDVMSERTTGYVDAFWELVDDTLNAVLFVLLGCEVLVVRFPRSALPMALAAIPITLAARWASVALPLAAMRPWRRLREGALTILTWGGLRGGLAVAMAFAWPQSPHREAFLAATYAVVVFSILVQGLTIERVARRVAH